MESRQNKESTLNKEEVIKYILDFLIMNFEDHLQKYGESDLSFPLRNMCNYYGDIFRDWTTFFSLSHLIFCTLIGDAERLGENEIKIAKDAEFDYKFYTEKVINLKNN